ncbi:MAG TPA: VOC family protein [Caulobacteraceae bacterium]|nr:VOC family protein [Caulobacteraceae bacterium]
MAPSDIRFRRLGYVALNVTDLERSRTFYTDIVGLTAGPSPEGAVLLRCSDRRVDVMLNQAKVPGLKRIGWQMESDKALAAARAHFTTIGLSPMAVDAAEAAVLGIGEAFRISEPTTGATFEFYADMATAAAPFAPTHTKISRLGHVVLNSTDREATERFLREEMNFQVSDRVEGMVSFMRCFPNPLHHSLGVGGAPVAGLNHVNFMVTDLDDVGRANNRMKVNSVPIVYGPGRHPPSDSVFLYFLDPDGMTVEYSFGMEEFEEAGAREPRMLPPSLESVDYWGGVPDPRFAKVGEIERLLDEVDS